MDPMQELGAKLALSALSTIFKEAASGVAKLSSALVREAHVHDIFGRAVNMYADQLVRSFSKIKILGMSSPLPLASIYTKVRVLDRIQKAEHRSSDFQNIDPYSRRIPQAGSIIPGIKVVEERMRIVILGKPGAGKTTFLRHLILEALSGNLGHLLPIFVSLNDLNAIDGSLFKHLTEQFKICELGDDLDSFLRNLLKRGRSMVLLDGLDEVSSTIRPQVIKEIIDLSEMYPSTKIVLTCRVAPYNYWFQNFSDFEIADFSDDDIAFFISKWFDRDPGVSSACYAEIMKQPSTKDLASTPLLLTMLCLSYDGTKTISSNKITLYRSAIDTLLIKWDASRNIRRDEPYKEMETRRKEDMLSFVAASTFEMGEHVFSIARLEDLVSIYISGIKLSWENGTINASRDIVEFVENNHGLLVERASGIHSFSHLSFHEYFVAVYIKNKGQLSQRALIEQRLEEYKWREVIVLTAGLLSDADDFILNILEKLVKMGVPAGFVDQLRREVEFEGGITASQQGLIKQQRSPSIMERRTKAVPTMFELSKLIQSRRDALDVDSLLRGAGTKALIAFLTFRATVGEHNEKAKRLCVLLQCICGDAVPLNANLRHQIRTFVAFKTMSHYSLGQQVRELTAILGERGVGYLANVVPATAVNALIRYLAGLGGTDVCPVIFDGVEKCRECLLEFLQFACNSVGIELDWEMKQRFSGNLDKLLADVKQDHKSLRGFRIVYVSELLLEILKSQVVLSRNIREAAMLTLMK